MRLRRNTIAGRFFFILRHTQHIWQRSLTSNAVAWQSPTQICGNLELRRGERMRRGGKREAAQTALNHKPQAGRWDGTSTPSSGLASLVKKVGPGTHTGAQMAALSCNSRLLQTERRLPGQTWEQNGPETILWKVSAPGVLLGDN